jgi:hypothetical protein
MADSDNGRPMVIGWSHADAKRRVRFGILTAFTAFSLGVVVGIALLPSNHY